MMIDGLRSAEIRGAGSHHIKYNNNCNNRGYLIWSNSPAASLLFIYLLVTLALVRSNNYELLTRETCFSK